MSAYKRYLKIKGRNDRSVDIQIKRNVLEIRTSCEYLFNSTTDYDIEGTTLEDLTEMAWREGFRLKISMEKRVDSEVTE